MSKHVERRLVAILAADVVGYSRMIRADEDGTLADLKALHAEIVIPKLAEHKGRIFKLMGDGMLVEFASVVDAVRAAVETLEAVSIRNAGVEEGRRFEFRVGINLGDVVIDGDDIQGDGVNIASRLEGIAEAGGICISGAVHDQVKHRLAVAFEDLGEREVRNIDEPVRVWRVKRQAAAEQKDDFLTRSVPRISDRLSIAVLPFENMSGDKEQEYFSDGIAEDIITDLSRISQLFVIARNSTFSYKGRSVKVQQISADLGAKYIVEGSVRRSGNRVRVTAQLVDGRSGGHLWAERYDRDLTDVFEVQDDIARNIVEALKIAIAPGERRAIEKIPTRNLEAYDCYLRGRQFLHEMTGLHLERARELFSKAIAVDQRFAVAFTGLADCDAILFHFYSADQHLIETAIRNSKIALELDPGLAEAHASLAYALSLKGDDAAADREFRAAIDLDPMLYEAYWYFGGLKLKTGDLREAAELFLRASSVRGDDLQSKMMLMSTYHGLGREADVRLVAQETFTIAARRLDLSPDDARAAYIGAQALIHMNDRPRALQWLNIAARIDSKDARTAYNLACGYSNLGEKERALDFLEISVENGRSVATLDWARIDPDLAAVRDHPRFSALLADWGKLAAGPRSGPVPTSD